MGSCGGSVDVSVSTSTGSGTITTTQDQTYSSFCQNGVTLDGEAVYTTKVSLNPERTERTEFDYQGLTVTDQNGQTKTLNSDLVCNYSYPGAQSQQPADIQCGFNSTFAANGTTYKVENLDVSFNAQNSTYSIASARVFHPDRGFVDIKTNTPLQYCSSTGYPNQGEIIITYYPQGISQQNPPTKTAQVTFSGCAPSNFTVTYGSGPTTVSGTLP
jgi:hypothetical protein